MPGETPGGVRGSATASAGVTDDSVASLAADLRKLKGVLGRLQRMGGSLATDADTAQFRELLHTTRGRVRARVGAFCAQVRNAAGAVRSSSLSRGSSRVLEAVVAGARELKADLASIEEGMEDTIAAHPHSLGSREPAQPPARGEAGRAGRQGQRQVQEEVQMLPNGTLEVQAAIMQERAEAAAAIAAEATAIREVMQDLATLVAEDHDRIQELDKNVDETLSKTKKGVAHLEKDADHQASAPCVIQ